MKKYLSLFSFIAVFFIGMQVSTAQVSGKQQSPEVVAKQKTNELHQLVKFNGKQQSAIFDVLVSAEKNMMELNKHSLTEAQKQERVKAIDATIEANFRKILTPEQYDTYKSSLTKDKK